MLSAPVPRNLRVRSSIQISSTRVPARAFLIVATLIFCGGLLIIGGADLLRTVKLTGALMIIALLLFEFRCWGRSMSEVGSILARHFRRLRQLGLEPILLTLPAAPSSVSTIRQPRWRSSLDDQVKR
jgi:hypothetical protein